METASHLFIPASQSPAGKAALAWVVLGLLSACGAMAQESHEKAKADTADSRLIAHEPSYLVLRQATGDEDALQAKFSFRYVLNTQPTRQPSVYFKYTGQFDFYAGTRPSSPVVNRLSNPALHYRHYLHKDTRHDWRWHWFDLGLEHRSNGQTQDISDPSVAAAAQRAYERGNHAFFDGLSRSADYISLEAKASQLQDDGRLAVYAKLKGYLGREDRVTWGPVARLGRTIADYDRLTLKATYTHARYPIEDGAPVTEASLEWTLGDKGLATDSLNLDLLHTVNVPALKIKLPLYLRFHTGPMNTLSDYTRSQRSVGFGLKFNPWW